MSRKDSYLISVAGGMTQACGVLMGLDCPSDFDVKLERWLVGWLAPDRKAFDGDGVVR